MIRNLRLDPRLGITLLSLSACATADDASVSEDARNTAVQTMQVTAGATVTLERGETGTTRILGMTPGFPVPSRFADPAKAALDFVATHHDAFQLTASEATDFVVTRVDVEPVLPLSHVTLQRVWNGLAVFHGAVTVHLTSTNGVFRALADESFRITPPTNRVMLSPSEAAIAAGRALGVPLALTQVEAEGGSVTFSSPNTLDPVVVEPKIVQINPDESRVAFQVLVSALDERKQQQYDLALIDAQDGAVLDKLSLVNDVTGRVFNVNAEPAPGQTTDIRTVVSFDGDPTASPNGWVTTPANKTIGNNAVAATDLNGNNTVGTNEVQPTANASNSFDFPYSPIQDATNFRAAAVANAFFLVNDWHDRTYKLGFTEAAGNFQTNNFGKGGAQNDPVNVDAQDGSGTNNANFATPPDGSRPRMQMFLFNIISAAVRQDGDFDPSVIYHENTHGLSNRLVGGGTTGCLNNLQSGGMGEGWGDFMGSSFRNDPVVGAYVTGNVTVGIRRASMAASPFTYADIKSGNLAEVHAAGELWAAALWDVRKALGAAKTEQLVVAGMKLTPCRPTMLQARDGIISADANINAGANRCAIWKAFAGRQMGTGASSPNDRSTTAIVTSTAVPAGC